MTFELMFLDLHENKPLDHWVKNMIGKPTLKHNFQIFLNWFKHSYDGVISKDTNKRRTKPMLHKIRLTNFEEEMESLFSRFAGPLTHDRVNIKYLIAFFNFINTRFKELAMKDGDQL